MGIQNERNFVSKSLECTNNRNHHRKIGDASENEELASLNYPHDSTRKALLYCKTQCCTKDNLKKRIPILSWLPKYNLDDFKGDLIAGATVAITVIPQGLAQANLANLPAQYGLYTAFMGCFMYAIFGSCKNITIGPTSVLSLMTAHYVTKGGITYCTLLTFLSGFIMLFMGILNLGILLTFISSPVISGFTTAAAITIATTQLAGLFGMKFQSEGFIDDVKNFFHCISIHQLKYPDMIMGICSIIFLLVLRYFRNVNLRSRCSANLAKTFSLIIWMLSTAKNAVLVVICAGIAAVLLAHGNNDITLTKQIQPGLPPFKFPEFSYSYVSNSSNQTIEKDFVEIVQDLGSGLIVIPLIAILETVAIAKSFANGKIIDGTQEMMALGICNIMGSFVLAYPATGSFSRTAINYSSGVRTPAGGIVTGLLVLLALGVMSPYFRFIPKSSLAAIIIIAVLNMIHYDDIILMWKTKRLDLIPYTITILVSLFWGLEYGILVGVGISLFFLLWQDAKPRILIEERETYLTNVYLFVKPDRSILFPSAEFLQTKILKFTSSSKNIAHAVIIDCDHVMSADYSTALCFKNITNEFQTREVTVIFVNLREPVLSTVRGALGSSMHHFDLIENAETFVDTLYTDFKSSLFTPCGDDSKSFEGIPGSS